MKPKKILTILGARPQFIKAAPLSKQILKEGSFEEILIHTGQHYDFEMDGIFFDTLHLPSPKYRLNHGQKSHLQMIGGILQDLENIFKQEKPDFVLVYGDTNSTLAGALASNKCNIPLIHVEAGLRSFDLHMPEEHNRILTDRISNILFCPTQQAVLNLHHEGFSHFECIIKNVGDVMLESSILFRDFAKKPAFKLQKDFVICTIHRAENTQNITYLQEILQALEVIAKQYQVLFPIHPKTSQIIDMHCYKNITFCKPLSYLEMLWLLENTSVVLTDSGGLQKESYFFKKPCLVLRENSEWVELITHQYNFLVGHHKEKILTTFANISKLCNTSYAQNFFGNADSSKQIIQTLKAF